MRFIVAEQLAAVSVEAEIALEPMRRDDDAASAREGRVMTLGVAPAFPATGYGYIQPGAPVRGTKAFDVERFVEKPDADTAARYIAQGYLWNSGNFLFRADVMLVELEMYAPDVLRAARAAVEGAKSDLDFLRFDGQLRQRAQAVHRLRRDEAHDPRRRAAGVLILVRHRHLGAIWKASARDKASKRPEADDHLRMVRPWGSYQRIDVGARFLSASRSSQAIACRCRSTSTGPSTGWCAAPPR